MFDTAAPGLPKQVRALSQTVREVSNARTRGDVLRIACREALRIVDSHVAIAVAGGELAVEHSTKYGSLEVAPEELAGFYEDRVVRRRPSSPSRFVTPLPEGVLVCPVETDRRGDVSMLIVADKVSGDFSTSDEVVLTQMAQVVSVALMRLASIEELERANQGKEHAMARVSHELRTPLTVILGWAAMLKANGDGSVREIADSIDESGRVAKKLVDDLYEYSRSSGGAMRLDLELVDLAAIAALTLSDVQPAAARKRISVEPPDQRGVMITADGSRLRQALWNLLTNAIKFTPEGGSVRMCLDVTPAEVVLTVADTGPGIPPEFAPHLFEPFRQHDPSRGNGLGLGLAIVRQIVEAHGGTVSAESSGSAGTMMYVRLPRPKAGG